MKSKQADLAGPGISTYEEVAMALPTDYEPLLVPKHRAQAIQYRHARRAQGLLP